ncbi:MAG: bifunctional adenosylcobinamide kinase/adenosylcobinamide-phosphate guanylyltransferase, partial [Acidobacteria bacterium]|nr:bifunctional adenosylcobinamide kinase/adenosylcobinamide-phosphate guanylyltransferase [Acidobacteriota bacterium]
MLTLIIGGARSGKSRYAQALCSPSSQVIYLATARADSAAADEEMLQRISRHRADRPAHWQTVEEPLDLAGVLSAAPAEAAVLIDCVTLWIANLMWEFAGQHGVEQEEEILGKVDELVAVIRGRSGNAAAGEVVVVSNEVGGGIVPEHPVGRAFRD